MIQGIRITTVTYLQLMGCVIVIVLSIHRFFIYLLLILSVKIVLKFFFLPKFPGILKNIFFFFRENWNIYKSCGFHDIQYRIINLNSCHKHE